MIRCEHCKKFVKKKHKYIGYCKKLKMNVITSGGCTWFEEFNNTGEMKDG